MAEVSTVETVDDASAVDYMIDEVQPLEESGAKAENTHVSAEKKEGHLPRYKNPILAIFAVMTLARKTMKDAAKKSKEETRLMKKEWERISHEVSDHHNTAATGSTYVQAAQTVATIALMAGPRFIKGWFPENQTAYNARLDGWYWIGTQLKNYAPDKESIDKWIDSGKELGNKAIQPTLQTWMEGNRSRNTRDVTVGGQQSEACRIEYQSREGEERDIKEQEKNIAQTNQRLMEQETNAMQVR
ncbi:MAG: hypothetical protein K1060chlam2_00953 [Chlamydiae bacterium]|nr:hypothetical protein [Chlamydiota bacterium]